MNRLLDKLALLLICLLSFNMTPGFYTPVLALLLSIICSSTVQILSGTTAACIIIAACSAMCGVVPVFFCALPLILYDALWEKKAWLTLPAITVFFRAESLSSGQFIATAAGLIISVIIYLRVSKLEGAINSLQSLRDEVTEQNLRLADKNKLLVQAQDNEVHLATLKERNRIAREIHDNVGHMLTRSILQSGALLIINKDPQLKEPLEELKNTLDSAMTSIRESVHGLHDESIDLKKLVADSVQTAGDRFKVHLDYDFTDSVPGKVKLAVAGIVKEGISNAIKHSNGDRINIVLREHPVFYQLMFEDNGSCSGINDTGIGLKNMEDRAASIGGTISFTPSEKGFRIFMSAPKEV